MSSVHPRIVRAEPEPVRTVAGLAAVLRQRHFAFLPDWQEGEACHECEREWPCPTEDILRAFDGNVEGV